MKTPALLLPATVAVALVGACVTAKAQAPVAGAGVAVPALNPHPTLPLARGGLETQRLTGTVIVTRDQVALRAAPNATAPIQATLWRGETLEVRGERGEYLQVWDHQRERGGFVAAALVYRVPSGPGAAAQLQAVLGFVAEQPQAESLGLALAAAAIHATPAAELAGPAGATLLDTVRRLGERLAERAMSNSGRAQDAAALSAHLDIAARLGVRFSSRETNPGSGDGRMALCPDGDAWQRLLALKAANAEQRARAALALTRSECLNGDAHPRQREAADRQRAEVLDNIVRSHGQEGEAVLPAHSRQRLQMRRASVWASLAFAAARRGDEGAARDATERAQAELGRVAKTELSDDDLTRHQDAALRVNAVRWAAAASAATPPTAFLTIRTSAAADGRTCVALVDTRWKDAQPALAERCTWGQVWAASVSVNREANAVALAVQPLDGWRELWVFQRNGKTWDVQVLPPAPATPVGVTGAGGTSVGYAEFAGWVPGGQQMLVAREAVLGEGRSLRRFEVLKLDTLTPERQHSDVTQLGAFNRWSDAAWKRDTLALR